MNVVVVDVPIPPNFLNPVLQAQKPLIINGNAISSADILAAKNFEITVTAAFTSDQSAYAELQAWKLYIIDLEHSRFMHGVAAAVGPAVAAAVGPAVAAAIGPAVAAAVGPAVTAAVGPAVAAAMQPFVNTLARTHNRLSFLQSINGTLHEVSNAAGESPGQRFPATVAEFEALTDAQLDDLAVFYGVGPATGVKLVKQRLLRPILGDYRSDQ